MMKVLFVLVMLSLVYCSAANIPPVPPAVLESALHVTDLLLESRRCQAARGVLSIDAIVIFFPCLDAACFTCCALS